MDANMCVAEFQCVVDKDGHQLPKEIAIVDLKGRHTDVYLFKPPEGLETSAKMLRTNAFLSSAFHGLAVEDGETEYSDLQQILRNRTRDYDTVLVKGLTKRYYMEAIVSIPVINVEDWGCPALAALIRQPPILCPIEHRGRPNCALRNAIAVRDWMATRQILAGMLLPITANAGRDQETQTEPVALSMATGTSSTEEPAYMPMKRQRQESIPETPAASTDNDLGVDVTWDYPRSGVPCMLVNPESTRPAETTKSKLQKGFFRRFK